MKPDKVHIKVFVTKQFKFRAEIKEVWEDYTGVGTRNYSVTVGGKEWQKGKGAEYRKQILSRCDHIISKLNKEFIEA